MGGLVLEVLAGTAFLPRVCCLVCNENADENEMANLEAG